MCTSLLIDKSGSEKKIYEHECHERSILKPLGQYYVNGKKCLRMMCEKNQFSNDVRHLNSNYHNMENKIAIEQAVVVLISNIWTILHLTKIMFITC